MLIDPPPEPPPPACAEPPEEPLLSIFPLALMIKLLAYIISKPPVPLAPEPPY